MLAVDLSSRDCIVLDMDAKRLYDGKRTAKVRAPSARILARLAQEQAKVVSRDDLMRVMGWEIEPAYAKNALREEIGFLRRALAKIGLPGAIRTHYAAGYELLFPVEVIARIAVVVPKSRMGVLLPAMAAGIPLPPQRLEARA